MGNEASLEGGAGEGPLPPGGSGPGPGPGAGQPPSALAGGGQLPAAGVARAAGPLGPGLGPVPGPGPGSVSRRLDPKEPLGSQRATSPTPKQASAASATAPGRESPRETRAQGPSGQEADGPRRTLQVDGRTQRSGRSPSVSPDRGSTPTSPYSVPQIAPLPSSTLCPICKTSDLTPTCSQPNFNTCTQCHSKVCNQCGFNPNPHLTQVKEWLCLNCQMQRALGMDMTTAPRSKSQQQLHSPALSPAHSPAKQPLGKPEQERSRGPGATQSGPRQAETARATSVPGPTQATAPPEVGRVSPQPPPSTKPSTAEPRPPVGEAQGKSATTMPSGLGAGEQPQEGLTGKLFGLGASLLTQASTLMSVQPEADSQGQPSPSKGPPKIVFSDASKEAGPRPPGSGPGPGPTPGAKTEPGARTGPGSGPGALAKTGGTASPKHGRAEHQAASKAAAKPKTTPKERATCPLCQAELNVGSKGPANYNTCTTCKLQVCNLCGFNPTPHLVEKTEWLCLNCQTKRLLEGSLGEPAPMPLPTSQQPPAGVPHRAAGAAPPKQKGPQGLGQPSGSSPAKASPQATKASPQAAKASPQAKPLRASEPSKTSSSAQEKKTGIPVKAEPVPKPPPETTVPPGTPKAKSGVKRTEPATSVIKPVPEASKGGEAEEPGSKPYSQDLSRSPQSLSDTGYSSDGVSSSQSEITGVVQQDVEQLDSAGVTGPRPPSPSELHKVGSSMRPSLEAQTVAPSGEWSKPPRSSAAEDQKRRPHSLSIMPEAYDSDEELGDILEEEDDALAWGHQREQQDTAESSDDFGSQLRHDYVEDSSEGGLSPLPPQPPTRAELTDEEFMRRQILEMSAEEDNLEEDDAAVSGRGLAKHSTQKGSARARPESSPESVVVPKRRLPHNATTGYEELLSEGGPAEPTDASGALQGGLRRFKTIELNSTGSYGHELDLSQGPDPSLDREPELEMESLTGSPEDRSRGEHSSTLPASTPSYTSGTSPTSLSSLEEDSDSSPSRRQRLEEAKQQRKARHRSHGPLLPTIEDSSEEEELREEEELLREQEKMREVEQQRIRSTARKTRRDKEELRAQRRRERSKTPPSNLSPIEDASPTEELRQAAEMEELHRSSCSEYSPSPSLDSETETLDGGPTRLYKSGSEYNLPAFMSLYSPTETLSGSSTTPSSGRPLKSAEEAYEDMMRKAELLQRQQGQVTGARGPHGGPTQPTGPRGQGSFEYQDTQDHDYGRAAQPAAESTPAGLGAAVYEEILQTSQSIARMRQASSRDLAFTEDKKKEKQFLNAESAYMDPMKQNGGPLTPGTSPTQLAAPVSFSTSTSSDSSGGRVIPDVRVTQHFAKEPQDPLKLHSSPGSSSLASKEVGMTFSQGPGTPATTVMAPCPASFPRGYMTPPSPAGTERILSPSSTAHSYGQTPTTANYGSQTEELPQAPSGPPAGGRAPREKPVSGADAEAGAPQSSRGYSYFTGSSPPLSPSTPSESPTFSPGKLGPRATAEFSTQTPSLTPSSDTPRSPGTPSPMVAQGTQTPHRPSTPRLVWQQSSQEAPVMVITLASDASSQTRTVRACASTSPLCSPTDTQPTSHSYSQTTPPSASQMPSEPAGPPGFPRAPSAGADGPLALYGWGALPAENISLCRISSVPGTSRVEPGPRPPGSAVVDLRTAVKPTPIILTDQGMDLTSLAVEARKYGLALDPIPGRQSTAVQPLVINLNAQEQTHTFLATATTVSITMASSVLMAQQKQPVVYGDPFQSRLDFGQGSGSPVCLAQVKQVEQAVQTAPYRGGPRGRPREAKFARYNLPNQVAPLARRDILITQVGTAQSVSLKPGPVPEPGGEPHRATPAELRSHALPGARKPHTVVVQMGEGTAGTVTTLLPEEPAGALDLTGMRPESQLACCDMVYKFPFGSSCTGTFHPAPSAPDKSVADATLPSQSSGPFYSPRDPEPPEPLTFRAQGVVGPGPHEEQRPYPQGLPGRLYSSMSDTNLAEAGLNYHAHRIGQLFQGPGRESAVDLSSLKHSYSLGFADGRYLGQGLQYGSFTDLRHPSDLLAHPLPMRRYSSVSNIYSDHRYGPRGDAVGFQEASLAQYSATTAREISRMCAALNSMDQYGGRHGSGGTAPDLVQYQPQHGPGLSAPQALAPLRSGLLGNPTYPEGQPTPGNLAQYGPAASQGTTVRQLLPSTATVRAADGMIYSTINTPIAATLPITTQPASVLRPMVRGGMYRPYVSGGVTAVPLTSLTRVPMIAPRVPLGPAGLYRYPAPSRFPVASSIPPAEGPVYLGKPAAAKTSGAGGPPRPELPAGAAREEPLSTTAPAAIKEAPLAPTLAPAPGQKPPDAAAAGGGSGVLSRPGAEKEEASQEERQRKQQEQLLQLERERVELEKLRQLRLQEELERERVELQRHREEEQLLVQRELQELQTIKQHVLQQQQEERQAQFALQREQLAQQRLQLEQIQQLQQQLQQQLEEQKQRQKAPFPPTCEAPSRGPLPAATELAQNGQYWPPLTHPTFIAMAGTEGPGQPREPVLHRGLPSSASDMSLQTEEQWEAGRSGIKKRHSMPRLRDACEAESGPEPCTVRRIADSSVQTDEEEGEGRYILTRRRRTRRSADCSVQTDDEDNAEWEQPVRRRRSRLSRHSDSGSDSKHDATASSAAATAARAMSSVGIQTISDCSVQTEPDQLPRVSPAIHITAATDPKVEIVRYISAPEKTGRGESLACQTEPDGQAQGVAGPQLIGPTAISPYLPGIQIVTPGPLGRFEKKKPDPLEIGYQAHLPPEPLSQLVSRQPPKSPQVLYSPVSPLSPHRLLDTSFASSERLNKAHVSPQKHFMPDSTLRQQTLPRPMKTLQRSLSDPKPLSPTAEESAKERFSLYQHQGGLGSQVSALPPNGLVRKVKRTLPSPPPEEAHLPLAGQVPSQLYAASLLQRGLAGPTTVPATKASLLRELDRDLRLVEHESTKLRKKQAELDEEEKEIDAKLKYLELGITQRKESLAKDRGGRDYPPLRGLGEHRDYLSDSELNQLRLQGCTTPSGQYVDYPASAAVPATPSGPTAFQQPRFPPTAPQYPAGGSGPTQNGFPAHQAPTYTGPSTYPAPTFPPGTSYPAESGLPSQQAFHPTGHYAAPTPMPTTQSTLYLAQADSRAPHQKPRQTSLADLEQKVPTNYEVITSPAVTMSSAPSETSYSGPAVSSSYEQGKAPELTRGSDRSSVSQSPAPTYPSDSHYTSLEQNVPRNYVMIDDISELTKDSTPTATDSQRLEPLGPGGVSGRPGKEPGEPAALEGPTLPCCYGRGEEESEEDSYDPRGKSGHHRSMESNGRPAGTHYYGDSDYRHGARAEKYGPGPMGPKHPSKSLAPAAISSKRSKHRKQGMEQKISKFSPIEEAKDVESDLASYPTPTVSSSLTSRGRKFQDEITYGLKKNVYEQQRYYGVSSRDAAEEDDRMYGGSSRSRVASAYSGEKLSSHDFSGRGKGYEREREAVERLQKAGPKPSSLSTAHSRARPPMRSQASEEESPVSPLGRPRPAGGTLPPGDTCPQFCSSHSMPDVQEHVKDGPRAHAYKREEGYILDDSHCVVSDSEAYHLGQEETDWFDKPRDARSDRFRHHGGHAVSSSQKRGPARHSYHDYDEPPEEGLWPHDEGGPGRHASAKEHRHHSDHGRHSGRHAGEEPGRRAAKPHARDMGRHETRPHPQASPAPAMQKKGQPGYPSSADYSQPSRTPSAYHHGSESKKGSRQTHPGPTAMQPKAESQSQPQMQARQAALGPQQTQSPSTRQMPPGTASRQSQMQQQQQQQQQQPQQQQGVGQQAPQQTPSQARLQQQSQPTTRGSAPAASQPAGKPQPGPTTAPGPQPAGLPRAEQASGSKAAAKVPQQGRAPQAQPAPGPGPTGVKPGSRPGGTPGAPAGQTGAEGESVFSKILPGGAAEQAGKLTEAVSAFGKKFSSFW